MNSNKHMRIQRSALGGVSCTSSGAQNQTLGLNSSGCKSDVCGSSMNKCSLSSSDDNDEFPLLYRTGMKDTSSGDSSILGETPNLSMKVLALSVKLSKPNPVEY